MESSNSGLDPFISNPEIRGLQERLDKMGDEEMLAVLEYLVSNDEEISPG